MIGQTNLYSYFKTRLDTFPQFILLVGQRGSGKRTLMKQVANDLGAQYSECDTSVDTIRGIIDSAYSCSDKIMYLIRDAGNMRQSAQNAILKLAEEPPKNVYIVLTVHNVTEVLETIRSRAHTYVMSNYSPEQLTTYLLSKHKNNALIPIVREVCETPGEVDLLVSNGGMELYDYVRKVIGNIAVVSGSNSFNIAKEINLGNDDSKFDLALFWKIFLMILANRMIATTDVDEKLELCTAIEITSDALYALRISSLNKTMLFDTWILDIREAWL